MFVRAIPLIEKHTSVGKSGRRWDSKDYFEMLTRTVMSQTANEIYVNTLTAEGHDLVKVSVQGAKDACRNWEGKVLSLTGKTKGYPTLAEAKASNEVLHPRCAHTLVFYDPQIEEMFDGVSERVNENETPQSIN